MVRACLAAARAPQALVMLRSAPAHFARVADMLATTAQFAEATRRLAEETRSMVPCERLTLAVRLTDGDRVVLIEPGENKHWSDLPLVPVAGTPLGQVLEGQVPDVISETRGGAELIVPLRCRVERSAHWSCRPRLRRDRQERRGPRPAAGRPGGAVRRASARSGNAARASRAWMEAGDLAERLRQGLVGRMSNSLTWRGQAARAPERWWLRHLPVAGSGWGPS
jgi:hypothetical protein